MSLYKDECVNTDGFDQYVVSFNSSQAAMLNSKIYECIEKSITGKIMEPKDLWSSTEFQDLIHISWSSHSLGLIDDVYIQTYLNKTADPFYAVMNIQSQVRMGSNSDRAQKHANYLLKCVNNNLKQVHGYVNACSL